MEQRLNDLDILDGFSCFERKKTGPKTYKLLPASFEYAESRISKPATYLVQNLRKLRRGLASFFRRQVAEEIAAGLTLRADDLLRVERLLIFLLLRVCERNNAFLFFDRGTLCRCFKIKT